MGSEDFLDKRLNERKEQLSFRQLYQRKGMIDFCSNDYLGIVRNGLLHQVNDQVIENYQDISGSTGSRLLSGNYALIEKTEQEIAHFHDTEAALIFNSGYDANIGLFSAVPQKGDTIIFDELSHASIRDGIRLSFAQAWSFAHNDLIDLEKKLKRATGNIFVTTESIFSMDGDTAPVVEIAKLCEASNAKLIIDEAHSTGVIGGKGEGLAQNLGIRNCFARVHTFGKALGAHGAVIVGSKRLREFLINFSRPFIYTTALPPAAVIAIKKAYELLPDLNEEREKLHKLIKSFHQFDYGFQLAKTSNPIQSVIIPGNARVKMISSQLADSGIDVRPILSPTVAKGTERLRIVLHSFNTVEELELLAKTLSFIYTKS